MAAFNKFNCFVADVSNKVHNLGSDVLKVMLTDTAPVATNTVKSNITEITAGNGYTAGGATVGIASSTQTAGLYKLMASGTASWTATGGSIAQFRYAVLYNSTAAGLNLIGWWDYGAEVNVTVGNSFTESFDGTNGILQLT
jgi:hypothetical protein